jgi:hypothetical protein
VRGSCVLNNADPVRIDHHNIAQWAKYCWTMTRTSGCRMAVRDHLYYATIGFLHLQVFLSAEKDFRCLKRGNKNEGLNHAPMLSYNK